ncbi:MAG TPA: hypothetical protein VGW80_10475 [Solirubrobacterales bacterium]|jgi:hypothetical protein|nr:hypothetical protein [Solirubrobacterales bacterium]
MPLAKVARALVLALALTALVAASATGDEALVEVNNIALRADGGFQPQTLPKRRFAPIDFQGHIDISPRHGRPLPPLQQALIDFDRDGRLNVAGLPTCAPETIAQLGTAEARRTCRGAIVGTGHVAAAIAFPGGAVQTSSALTIFNGPPLATGPSVILHARTVVPTPEIYAIVVPIERRRGGFRYRARIDLPPLAGGLGALTHIDAKIGRRYRAAGRLRSYVSARCSDNVLQTHGRFTFADGTVISGLVEKYCNDM